MKHKEDIDDCCNEEDIPLRKPNDGFEEIDIEPIDWDDL